MVGTPAAGVEVAGESNRARARASSPRGVRGDPARGPL